MANGNSKNMRTPLRIGMAQTLNYYLDRINWIEFFMILDCEVVISKKSNIATLNIGEKYATNEQCFPVKVFYGHIMELAESKIDYIFISQLISQDKGTFCCPRIISLPMLIKNTIENIPPIITVPINQNNSRDTFLKIFSMAFQLCKNPFKVSKALNFFKKEFNKTAADSASGYESKKNSVPWHGNKIGVIAHAYSINDDFLSMRLIERINSYGFSVVTISDLEKDGVLKPDRSKPYFGFRPLHWNYGQKVLAAVEHFLNDDSIDGIVNITYFGCGIDAFIEVVFKADVNEKKPYLCVALDEHTGQSGLVTRIEAFLDMIPCNKGGISV